MAINVTPNDTIEGGLTVKDADGDILSGASVAFTSSDESILGVVDNGDGTYKATAAALGDGQIQATVGGDTPISLSLDVHVQTGPAVAATFSDPVITTVDAG